MIETGALADMEEVLANPSQKYDKRGQNDFGPLTHSQGQNHSVPDFTLLFENGIITLGPLSLAFLILSLRVLKIILYPPTRKLKEFGGGAYILKQSLYAALVVISFVYLIALAKLSSDDSITTSILSFAAAIISLCCTVQIILSANIYSIRASTLNQLVLALWLFSDGASIRTSWYADRSRVPMSLTILSAIIKFVLVIVEEISKRGPLGPLYDKYPPEALSGIWNRLILGWLNPLMLRGLIGKPLSLEDLWPIETQFSTQVLSERLDPLWNKISSHGQNRKPNLFFLLTWEFKWLFFLPTPTRFLQAAFAFSQPFLIQSTLEWYESPPSSDSDSIGYGLLGAYALVYLGIALTTAFGQYQIVRFITAIRGSLVLLVFRKTLKLKSSDNHTAPITLMSTDVERIVQGLHFVHETFVSFFTFSIALWLLKRQLGVGAIAPIVIAILTASLIGTFGGRIDKAQKRWVKAVEERVAVTTQVLTSMESIKMSGLNNYISTALQLLRTTELQISLAMRRFLTLAVGLSFTTPNFSPVLGFAVYIAVARQDGRTLLSSQAFTVLSIFNLLSEPLNVLIQTLPALVSAYACFTRIGDFLRGDSLQDTRDRMMFSSDFYSESQSSGHFSDKFTQTISPGSFLAEDDVVSIVNGNFRYAKDSKLVLQDITIHVKRASITLILGQSGSGKTALLEALLGEVPYELDSIHFDPMFDAGSEIAYCSQQVWLRTETVRNNILNGLPYDKIWYEAVVYACALDEEIELLHSGSLGHNGSNISGGQKQRIALARTVYSRRDLVLLDDTLSGLDSTSEQKIMERLFGSNGLFRLAGLSVILATHSAKHVNLADQIIVLDADGRISKQTSSGNIDLEEFSTSTQTTAQNLAAGDFIPFSANPFAFSLATKNEVVASDIRDLRKGELDAYKYYFLSLGLKKLYIAIGLVVLFVVFSTFPQIWLQWWTASNVAHPNNRLGYWISLYALYGFLAIVSLILGSWLLICNMVKHSAESLHSKLVNTIVRAAIFVFSLIDPGLMVNRFSQDMSLVDMELPLAFANTMITFITILAQIIIIAVSSRYLGAAIPFVVAVAFITQRLYIRTSRQLRFLDLEAKGPLYTQFIETINGLPVIRAFGLQRSFTEELHNMLDTSQKPFYLLFCVQRWLGLVLNLTNTAMALLLIGIASATREKHVGFLGVALTNIMTFGNSLSSFIDIWSTLETSLAAVERVKHFSEETPAEVTTSPQSVPPKWPPSGAVDIKNLTICYKNKNVTKAALNAISLSIPPGKKIAICGSSGSGKSTLCKSLLRMTDWKSGCIFVDGQDISRVPHEVLRMAFSVVPQEPALLNGSIRLNVDPYSLYSDEEVVGVLQKVTLWDKVKDTYGTQEEIDVNAMSFGQKQMLCLSRALLKMSKVLILDEATSSLDSTTDLSIHTLVCKDLPGQTVVSVMHRLENVKLYDLVAVIDKGQLVELGPPTELLRNQNSSFGQLYQASTSS